MVGKAVGTYLPVCVKNVERGNVVSVGGNGDTAVRKGKSTASQKQWRLKLSYHPDDETLGAGAEALSLSLRDVKVKYSPILSR